MYVLVVREPDGNETEYDLAGEVVLGRDESADIRLGDAAISRKHLRIFLEDGLCYIEDLGSANGSSLEGHPIVGAVVLESGRIAVAGPFQLWVEDPDAVEGGAGASAEQGAEAVEEGTYRGPAPVPEGAPTLQGLGGVAYGQSFELGPRSTVGRENDSMIALQDPSVSRHHAEIVVRGEQIVVRDLGSSNGSYVNDVPITQEAVYDGDIIRFGDVELQISAGEAVAPLLDPEAGAQSSAPQAAPLRVGARRPARRGGGAKAKRKKLLLVAGGAVTLLLVVGLLKKKPQPAAPIKTASGAAQREKESVGVETFTKMRRARHLILDSEWTTAETLLRQVIDLDPINKEARDALASCILNKRMEQVYKDGKSKMALGEDMDALKLFTKVDKNSSYYEQAQFDVQSLIKTMLKNYGAECKGNFSARKYKDAIRTCRIHQNIACQCATLNDEVASRALQRAEKYLHVKADARWRCPVSMSQWVPCAERGGGQDEERIKNRYQAPRIRKAMLAYYQGEIGRSALILQKIKSSFSDPKRDQAARIFTSLKVVEGKWKEGQSLNMNGDPEAAQKQWSMMLIADSKLMPEKVRSYYQRESRKELAKAYYAKGQQYLNMERYTEAFGWCSKGIEVAGGGKQLKECLRSLDGQAAVELKRSFTCDEFSKVLSMTQATSPIHRKALERAESRDCKF